MERGRAEWDKTRKVGWGWAVNCFVNQVKDLFRRRELYIGTKAI